MLLVLPVLKVLYLLMRSMRSCYRVAASSTAASTHVAQRLRCNTAAGHVQQAEATLHDHVHRKFIQSASHLQVVLTPTTVTHAYVHSVLS
jgi:hypothetical protein